MQSKITSKARIVMDTDASYKEKLLEISYKTKRTQKEILENAIDMEYEKKIINAEE